MGGERIGRRVGPADVRGEPVQVGGQLVVAQVGDEPGRLAPVLARLRAAVLGVQLGTLEEGPGDAPFPSLLLPEKVHGRVVVPGRLAVPPRAFRVVRRGAVAVRVSEEDLDQGADVPLIPVELGRARGEPAEATHPQEGLEDALPALRPGVLAIPGRILGHERPAGGT